jgi:ABC-type polysaccharide/polyol phosphate export permease
MFGGYFYTWMAINSISHIAGILNLFNPVMLACETLRAAVLGQKGYIDFWFAILGLWLFIILFALFGVIRLKKRLDCV